MEDSVKLKELLDQGFINNEEYENRLQTLRGELMLQLVPQPPLINPTAFKQNEEDWRVARHYKQKKEERKQQYTAKYLPQKDELFLPPGKLSEKDLKLAKTISYLLKQNNVKSLQREQGYCSTESLLRTKQLQSFTEADIEEMVKKNRAPDGQARFELKYLDGLLFIRKLDELPIEERRQQPKKRSTGTRHMGNKHWFGLTVEPPQADSLIHLANSLRFRMPSIHFTFGWCRMTNAMFSKSNSMEDLTEAMKEIAVRMCQEVQLKFSNYDLIGKEKNKIAAVYLPFLIETEEEDKFRFLEYNQELQTLFRKEAEAVAAKRKKHLSIMENETGTLEYGVIGGDIIYEMRAITPLFHVTIGFGSNPRALKSFDTRHPTLRMDASRFYINAGKTRAFAESVENLKPKTINQ